MKWYQKLFSRLRALRIVRNLRGALSAKQVTLAAVALLLVGILGPIGISEIANATTTNWNASVITIFQTVLPILAVIGMALGFLKFGGD